MDPATSTTDETEGESVGSTAGLACDADDSEPNDNEGEALELDPIDDTDSSGSQLGGILEGSEDEDWFSYEVTDGSLAILEPQRILNADGPIRLCKYYRCNTEQASKAVCDAGADTDLLADGTSGCCADDQDVAMDVECTTGDDSGTVFVRLSTTANACVSYTVDYNA